MNKKLKIIFGSSLGLNLLLIGFVAGNILGPLPLMLKPHHPMKHFPFPEEVLVQGLPHEKQNAARDVLSKMRKIREINFKAHKQTIDEVEKIVTAEKFDEQKFLKSFKKLGDSMTQVKDQCDVEVAKFLTTLNKEERINLLKQVKLIHPPFDEKFAPSNEHPEEFAKKPL